MAQRAPGAGTGSAVVISTKGGLQLRHMEGVRTPIIDFVKGHLPAYIRQRIIRDGAAIPVGLGKFPVLVESGGVPQLPGSTIGTPTFTGAPLPGPTIVQDQAPNQGNILKTMTLRDFLGTGLLSNEQWNRAMAGNPGSPSEIAALKAKMSASQAPAVQQPKVFTQDPFVIREPAITTPPIVAPTKPTTTGGSMDLGSIITDLGTAYIKTKYAPSPTFSGPVAATPAFDPFAIGGDIVDYFTDPGTGAVVPVKKKKPCRRRRRRLATKSDLGDLAALKAILGNGEVFKAWIATHSR